MKAEVTVGDVGLDHNAHRIGAMSYSWVFDLDYGYIDLIVIFAKPRHPIFFLLLREIKECYKNYAVFFFWCVVFYWI
jgi:hypothetical protein